MSCMTEKMQSLVFMKYLIQYSKAVYMLLKYFINKDGKLHSHFKGISFPNEYFVTLHTSMALKLIYGKYISTITKLITLLTMLFRFRNYSPLYVESHPPNKSNTSCNFNDVCILCHISTSFIICFWENQKCDLLGSKGFWRWCINPDYWVSGLCLSSGILKTREHNVLETGSVSVLWWAGDTYSVGSLRDC
jgi:hypothetical protein